MKKGMMRIPKRNVKFNSIFEISLSLNCSIFVKVSEPCDLRCGDGKITVYRSISWALKIFFMIKFYWFDFTSCWRGKLGIFFKKYSGNVRSHNKEFFDHLHWNSPNIFYVSTAQKVLDLIVKGIGIQFKQEIKYANAYLEPIHLDWLRMHISSFVNF